MVVFFFSYSLLLFNISVISLIKALSLPLRSMFQCSSLLHFSSVSIFSKTISCYFKNRSNMIVSQFFCLSSALEWNPISLYLFSQQVTIKMVAREASGHSYLVACWQPILILMLGYRAVWLCHGLPLSLRVQWPRALGRVPSAEADRPPRGNSHWHAAVRSQQEPLESHQPGRIPQLSTPRGATAQREHNFHHWTRSLQQPPWLANTGTTQQQAEVDSAGCFSLASVTSLD